jgi:hypothetical protein
MYLMLEEFFKILTEKETPIMKVNALFALKMMLETCEYPVVEMIEAFLLPVLQEVAMHHSDKQNYGKPAQFFKDQGYAGSIPNLEQLSHNYVLLGIKLVFLGAAIKQNCYFYTDRLITPSAFQNLAKKLR